MNPDIVATPEVVLYLMCASRATNVGIAIQSEKGCSHKCHQQNQFLQLRAIVDQRNQKHRYVASLLVTDAVDVVHEPIRGI